MLQHAAWVAVVPFRGSSQVKVLMGGLGEALVSGASGAREFTGGDAGSGVGGTSSIGWVCRSESSNLHRVSSLAKSPIPSWSPA